MHGKLNMKKLIKKMNTQYTGNFSINRRSNSSFSNRAAQREAEGS
jgi:hypothetical protein